jgi:hypothetical protein
MGFDQSELLQILNSELKRLENGSPRSAYDVQDSPICLNYHRRRPRPCGGCALWPFVPEQAQSESIPCEHIPLDASGRTLATLSDKTDAAEAIKHWLRRAIEKLNAA